MLVFLFYLKRKIMAKKIKAKKSAPLIGIIMGSQSDWSTMHHAEDILKSFSITCETFIVSAHRTPERLYNYAGQASSRGIKVIIAGAGGAAHLPGMAAAMTTLPVLGVPVESKALKGLDSLLSIAQMPAGIPVGTLAIGEAGAKNAALLAISILALEDKKLSSKLAQYRALQTASVAKKPKK
jgi:5-(carboxyamino)imidazole ribonucleotide mutase